MRQSVVALIIICLTSLCSFGQEDYLNKGNDYLNSKQFDKAEQTFRDGIKADSTNLIYQCQLGLTLIQLKKYSDAQNVLDKVLKLDSNNIGAIWYNGIGNFYNQQYKPAISNFEKALTLLDKNGGQYYSANWFIGKCYSNLLKTVGLSYSETNRMFECYEEYMRLQPNAKDVEAIKEYVERKKKRRPPNNVEKWIDL